MKNKISILLLSLITVFAFTACEEEQEVFDGPYRLSVGGPGAAVPETTATFTLGDIRNPESYTWSVEGPAQIVGAANGATVAVEFLSVGVVELSVTNGTDFRDLSVVVEPVVPNVTGSLSTTGTGSLRSGESDTVYFEFDAPFASIESLEVSDDALGSLGELTQIEGNRYFAIFTAGEGEGTPQAEFANIVGTEAFGGEIVETASVELPSVDNTAPTANLSYSQNRANQGSEVTVTATFSEEVMGERNISLTQDGATVTDTLASTEDPMVYTYTYTVGEGEGSVSVELTETTDAAGNEIAAVANANRLVVDNTAPVAAGNAVDNGSVASISILSDEAGTGMYLVMAEGTTAPTTPEEFMNAEGIASGSVELNGNRPGIDDVILSTGTYSVHFLAMDEAGNASTITSTTLEMD